MVFDNNWWCFLVNAGVGWWMLVFDGQCWRLTVFDEWWCFKVNVEVGVWWWMINDGLFVGVGDGF